MADLVILAKSNAGAAAGSTTKLPNNIMGMKMGYFPLGYIAEILE